MMFFDCRLFLVLIVVSSLGFVSAGAADFDRENLSVRGDTRMKPGDDGSHIGTVPDVVFGAGRWHSANKADSSFCTTPLQFRMRAIDT